MLLKITLRLKTTRIVYFLTIITIYAKFNTLRPRKHEVTTECVRKVALSANDDKRHIIPNDPEHKTLALGHYSLINNGV